MQLNYRIVFIVTFLLITLSLSMSIINYLVSMHATQVQLKERSLPLTVDNIYTEIQKHIIEPNLVSSMMAHDTFLKDWLVNEEDDVEKITRYLESIKNKYNMFTTFLVSEKTKNYYTSKGFIEKVSPTRPENAWYFDFQKNQNAHEINLDFNNNIDESMIMFINHKIFDPEFHMIGATGIGLRVSYINDMLKRFRKQYNFKVYFLNASGEVILFEHGENTLRHIKDSPELYALKDDLITKQNKLIEYSKMGEEHLLNTKYIPELDLYLVVEAKLSHFMEGVVETFYFNLVGSLLVTILITLLILVTIKKYHKKLEYFASNDALTDLPNRRSFDKKFQQFFLLQKRNYSPISLLFFDLDDFKYINDTHGHQCGDKVLKRIAQILKEHIRQTDLIARWGGEEFIVAFIDCDLEEAKVISEKLRKDIEEDEFLHQSSAQKVTASFGLTSVTSEDNIDTLLKRVDKALYEAKNSGKNQVVVR